MCAAHFRPTNDPLDRLLTAAYWTPHRLRRSAAHPSPVTPEACQTNTAHYWCDGGRIRTLPGSGATLLNCSTQKPLRPDLRPFSSQTLPRSVCKTSSAPSSRAARSICCASCRDVRGFASDPAQHGRHLTERMQSICGAKRSTLTLCCAYSAYERSAGSFARGVMLEGFRGGSHPAPSHRGRPVKSWRVSPPKLGRSGLQVRTLRLPAG